MTVEGHIVDLTKIMHADSSAVADESVARAVATRGVIEQAKGIIMSCVHVDEDAAFGILAEASQRSQRKLRDVALELVQRGEAGSDLCSTVVFARHRLEAAPGEGAADSPSGPGGCQ